MSNPDVVKLLPERYVFRYEDGVEICMERFDDKRSAFTVELTVLHAAHAADVRMLSFGTLNLTAPNSRKALAKTLSESHHLCSFTEWQDRLEACSYLAVKEWRNGGEPFRDLKTVEVDMTSPALLLPPLVPAMGVVLNYGNGEVGKSLLVMAQVVTVATGQPVLGFHPTRMGRVLYLDWEDNGESQRERAEALCRGAGFEFPPDSVIFRYMNRSLADCEEMIRNTVAEHEIVLVVVDSLGMAVGADPNDPMAVIQGLNVLARLGVPAIVIHHLSAEQAYGHARKEKPYGSIYARNTARLTWLLERDVESDGPLYLTNTKANRARRHDRIAFDSEIEYDANDHMTSARYTATNATSYRAEMGKATDLDRVKAVLRGQKAPASVIASRAGMSASAVRTVFSRFPDHFGSERRGRENWWFLPSDREDEL